jgi:hypothetical protein
VEGRRNSLEDTASSVGHQWLGNVTEVQFELSQRNIANTTRHRTFDISALWSHTVLADSPDKIELEKAAPLKPRFDKTSALGAGQV